MKISTSVTLISALTALVLVAIIFSICQHPKDYKKEGPVITLANAPPIDYSMVAIKLAKNILPGPPGPQKNWDFSSMIEATDRLDTSGYLTVLNRLSRPEGNESIDSGFCVKGTKGANTIYFYYVLNASLFADTLTIFQGNRNIVWPMVKPELKFPFHYGDTLIKLCQKLDQSIHADTVIYDAYGDIKTPFGNYKDVIRLHYIDGKGEPNYEWWTSRPFFALMCYTPSGGTRFYIPVEKRK